MIIQFLISSADACALQFSAIVQTHDFPGEQSPPPVARRITLPAAKISVRAPMSQFVWHTRRIPTLHRAAPHK